MRARVLFQQTNPIEPMNTKPTPGSTLYTAKPAGHRIEVWFDHVVVAADYIGPMGAR